MPPKRRPLKAPKKKEPKFPLTKPQNARSGFPGEKHAPIKMSLGKWKKGNYEGPGTNLKARLDRGDQPISYADKVSQAHDIRYNTAKSAADVRKADLKMIKLMGKQGRGKDFPVNLAVGRTGIKAKVFLEKAGIVNPTTFTTFGGVSDKDRPKFEAKLKSLNQQGFGKTTWLEHVAAFRKKNPGMSFKEALAAASKTWKK